MFISALVALRVLPSPASAMKLPVVDGSCVDQLTVSSCIQQLPSAMLVYTEDSCPGARSALLNAVSVSASGGTSGIDTAERRKSEMQ